MSPEGPEKRNEANISDVVPDFNCRPRSGPPSTPSLDALAADTGKRLQSLRQKKGKTLEQCGRHLGGAHMMSALAQVESGARYIWDFIDDDTFTDYVNWLNGLPDAVEKDKPPWVPRNR